MTDLIGCLQDHAASCRKTRLRAQLVSVALKLILDHQRVKDLMKVTSSPGVNRIQERKVNRNIFQKPPKTGGLFLPLIPIFET